MESDKLLSILIPTVVGRETELRLLLDEIHKQIGRLNCYADVEVLIEKDNKEISTGAKRQLLYDRATALYSWQLDDDDMIANDAIELILKATEENHDVISLNELCILQHETHIEYKLCTHSIAFDYWEENIAGWDFVRCPFYKDVIKSELCKQVRISDIRYGDDHDFSLRIRPLLKTETHIDKFLYLYNFPVTMNHNERYGIK